MRKCKMSAVGNNVAVQTAKGDDEHMCDKRMYVPIAKRDESFVRILPESANVPIAKRDESSARILSASANVPIAKRDGLPKRILPMPANANSENAKRDCGDVRKPPMRAAKQSALSALAKMHKGSKRAE